MSGRVRTTLADGRRVTGYRKTLRQNPRTPAHLLPFMELSFMLPADMRFLGIKPGQIVIGAALDELGRVVVTGKALAWVERQAVAAVRKLAPDWVMPITARLTRPAEPGPTESGPLRPAIDRALTLRFDGQR